MIRYATLGAHDLKVAIPFYDKLFATIGMSQQGGGDWGMAYGPKEGVKTIYIMKPVNGLPASFGNGAMLTFEAPNRAAVDQFHATALGLGGFDEGKPGIRGGADSNFYAAYVRDLTGNKICAVCTKAT
jgi:hypothetical protein